MEWRDEGIIIGVRRHGETSVILEVMTRGRGRHLGLVRGGRSRRLQPVLQVGNRVELTWRARLDEHLGAFQAEALDLNATRFFASPVAIYGLQTIAAHLRLLPERDPHPGLFDALRVVIGGFDDPVSAAELLARFELLVLEELGFGLDLTRCAATGVTTDLVYVSPRSGRAVSASAGRPWHDRMLALPSFLMKGVNGVRGDLDAYAAAFRLTGHFFERDVYGPRGISLPEARAGFVAALRKSLGTVTARGDDGA
ncbi:MAG: DNA repair protein RecO [Rhizobiaceae bacterium]|nr:DNA repair protein RecO [Rhizobiaceae bacterium]MCV0408058.1 DNA repair protein RecO [Rhizobiaceae bacterium]